MPARSNTFQRGYTTLLVIVFGGIFTLTVGALAGRVMVEQSAERVRMHKAQARTIAEAGLEYYKWYLAHHPNDLTHGTGIPGPYVLPLEDPETGPVGTFSLSITGNEQCGALVSVDVESIGRPSEDPSVRATVTGRYMRPSVAEYSYIVNDNVWAGPDRTILGRYHANGGVRMDGTSNSLVTSSQEEVACFGTGCSPGEMKPGVFGDGPNQELWEYPVPQFDFGSIEQDLHTLQTLANQQGISLSPNGQPDSERRGWRLIFRENGAVDIYRVDNATGVLNSATGLQDFYIPSNVRFYRTETIPPDCGLIFVRHRVWVSGTVSGKVTLVAAEPNAPGRRHSIIIEDNLRYATGSGADGLTLIAQDGVHIAPHSPSDLTIEAIAVAQGGNFGRNLYICNTSPYDKKDLLTMRGSVVSNLRGGTKWLYGGGGCGTENWSGYNERVNAYDRGQLISPPPFTPTASPDFRFIEWREK